MTSIRACAHVRVHFRWILTYNLFCIPKTKKPSHTGVVSAFEVHNLIKNANLTFPECISGQNAWCIWNANGNPDWITYDTFNGQNNWTRLNQIIFIAYITTSLRWNNNNNQPHSHSCWMNKNYLMQHGSKSWSHCRWRARRGGWDL